MKPSKRAQTTTSPKHAAPAPKAPPPAPVEIVVEEAPELETAAAPERTEEAPPAVEDAPAAPPAPEVAPADVDARASRRAAIAAMPAGRRKFAAKVALRAAVDALDAFPWTEWQAEGLDEARAILAAGIAKLEATTLPRAKRTGIAVGGRVRFAEKHAATYLDALDEGDADALTVAGITGSMVRLSTPSGTRLVVPSKALVAA